jgi:3-dehydroquinate dehydratase/shikimate dehydrogenase
MPTWSKSPSPPANPADNLRVLALLRNAPKPTVAHCMGEIGFPSRILSLVCGAAFTYAAFNKERSIAPGLPDFDELVNLYQVHRLTPQTRLFAVVGDPIGHSYSPLLHNLLYRELGIDAVYLPMRVPEGELAATLEAYRALPVAGYSVTIPHKQAAAALAQTRDRIVEHIGAANTLLHTAEGFAAYNTDHRAVLDSLLAHLPAEAPGYARVAGGQDRLAARRGRRGPRGGACGASGRGQGHRRQPHPRTGQRPG